MDELPNPETDKREVLYVCMMRTFRNGCIENFHFVLRRSDWLEQLREYAASNQQ